MGNKNRDKDSKEMRRLKQLIRRNMITKVKPDGKIYTRKTIKDNDFETI